MFWSPTCVFDFVGSGVESSENWKGHDVQKTSLGLYDSTDALRIEPPQAVSPLKAFTANPTR